MHDRDGTNPPFGLRERGTRLGRLQSPTLEPQERRDRLEVVLHPVMDLADRRVLREQQPIAPAEVADVTQEHECAGGLFPIDQRQHPHQHRDIVSFDLLRYRKMQEHRAARRGVVEADVDQAL